MPRFPLHFHTNLILIPLIFYVTLGYSAAQNNGSLILRGTKTSFENFTGIDPNVKDSLRYIELEYVNFHPNELVDAIRDCNNLETVHLRRLKESQWKFTKRVRLPRLKTFTIDVPYFSNGPTEQQFKSMLFFDKKEEWKLEEIPNLFTDIKLSQYSSYPYNGDTFHSNLFEINHSEGKFVTRLDPFIYKLLRNLEHNFEVNKLAVVDWTGFGNGGKGGKMPALDPEIVQPSVRNLELGYVKLKKGSKSEFIARTRNLEQLSFLAIPISLDIADLPTKSLRKLEIGSMENVTFSEIIQFPKLTTLKYFFSPIPDLIIDNYTHIFPWVKFVDFRLKENKGSLRLLRNILGTCAQKISLFDFNWGKYCATDKSQGEEDPGMIQFLKNANVPLCQLTFFRLTKDKVTGQWYDTEYSEEYDKSFNAGVDVPDTIEGEGEFDDCGVNLYKPMTSTPPTTIPEVTTEKPTTTTTNQVPIENKCTDTGFFANEIHCSRFYRCVENSETGTGEKSFTKYEFSCPPATLFDTISLICDHMYEANTHPDCINSS